jgi:hypothetical protein
VAQNATKRIWGGVMPGQAAGVGPFPRVVFAPHGPGQDPGFPRLVTALADVSRSFSRHGLP